MFNKWKAAFDYPSILSAENLLSDLTFWNVFDTGQINKLNNKRLWVRQMVQID